MMHRQSGILLPESIFLDLLHLHFGHRRIFETLFDLEWIPLAISTLWICFLKIGFIITLSIPAFIASSANSFYWQAVTQQMYGILTDSGPSGSLFFQIRLRIAFMHVIPFISVIPQSHSMSLNILRSIRSNRFCTSLIPSRPFMAELTRKLNC